MSERAQRGKDRHRLWGNEGLRDSKIEQLDMNKFVLNLSIKPHTWISQAGIHEPQVVRGATAKGPWNNNNTYFKKILWPYRHTKFPQIVTSTAEGNKVFIWSKLVLEANKYNWSCFSTKSCFDLLPFPLLKLPYYAVTTKLNTSCMRFKLKAV